MLPSDREAFITQLSLVAETLSEAVSTARYMAYFEALKDLPWESLRRAMEAGISRSWKFFPKPMEIRELAEGSAEPMLSGVFIDDKKKQN